MSANQPAGEPLSRRPPDPYEVIRSFFEQYQLWECQSELWKMLSAAFSSEDADFWDRRDRGNAVFFCKNLDEVLKALYALRESIASRKDTENP